MARQHRDHIDGPAAFGRRLHEARSAAGLRLVDLAFPGCSVAYLSHLENGKRVPSLQVVRELARRVGVTEDWLAQGDSGRIAVSAVLVEAAVASRLEDREAAESLYRVALDNATSDADRARAKAGLANLLALEGELSEAVAAFEEARALDPDLESDPGFAEALGRLYARTGEMDESIAVFRRRLSQAEADEDTVSRTRFAVLLANALIDSSRYADAAVLLGDILVAEPGANDPVTLAQIHWSQSRLHTLRKNHVSAERHARAAFEILEATEYLQQRARAHHLLAYIELESGRPLEALALIEQGRELADAGRSVESAGLFDIEEARARAQLGDVEAAIELVTRAAAKLEEHDPVDIGRGYAEIARAMELEGDLQGARALYELALEHLERSLPNGFHDGTLVGYAGLLERLGERDLAFEAYRRAATGLTELAPRGRA